jgi:hypothetical protein
VVQAAGYELATLYSGVLTVTGADGYLKAGLGGERLRLHHQRQARAPLPVVGSGWFGLVSPTYFGFSKKVEAVGPTSLGHCAGG